MQEITLNDPFGLALEKYSNGLGIGVEIGGGTGDGSTQCIQTKELFSFEIHPDRIGRHQMNLDSRQNGIAIHELSSSSHKWMSRNDVVEFYNNTKTNLNQYPIETILGWHKEDFLTASKYMGGKTWSFYNKIDFLLLDGGAFSGRADFEEWFPKVRDGGVIALDDVNDIKNYENYNWLMDANHHCLWSEPRWRNGCAIFKK